MMIRHICMFKLKEENKNSNIYEFCERAEKLRELHIIKKFNVVQNTKNVAISNFDVALVFDFDTVEALEMYQNSAQHLKFGEFVSSIREERACIDYVI